MDPHYPLHPPSTLTPSQLHSYLKHINYAPSHLPTFTVPASLPPPTYEFLCQLMWLHLGCIPWENLSMHYGDGEVVLELQKLWGKVVGRGGKSGGGWGGYCMQTNGLFLAVLRACGFVDAWAVGARISRTTITSGLDRSGRFEGWSHMCILVPIDGQTYQCDVGFGAKNPTVPLPLIPDIITPGLAPHSYRLLHQPLRECRNQSLKSWILQIQNSYGGEGKGDVEGEWLDAYMFSAETEFLEDDYEVMSYTVSHRPGSMFANTVLCVRATLEIGDDGVVKGVDGRYLLIGDTLKRVTAAGVELVEKFETEEQRVRALEKYFGIVLEEEERKGIVGRVTELLDANVPLN